MSVALVIDIVGAVYGWTCEVSYLDSIDWESLGVWGNSGFENRDDQSMPMFAIGTNARVIS